MITEIRLRQFRCFDSLEVFPGSRHTYIVGNNAQGKTSILEAVCFLLRLQSPRTSTTTEVIQAGTSGFSIEGIYADTRLTCRYSDEGRSIFLDSKPQSKSDDYLATARVTWFANTDLELVRGGGSNRRRYLDFLGVQSVPGYRKALRDYEKALRSRNSLLKEGRPRREIAAFDAPLLESGEFLINHRRSLCLELAPLAAEACAQISHESDALHLIYQPACQSSFAQSLADSIAEENRLRQTVCGPHRDDVDLLLNGLKASNFASEGQQRGIALALKIAQARRLDTVHQSPPLLLLDDVFGELDTHRRNCLLEALPRNAQALITTTFLDWMAPSSTYTIFKLSDKRLVNILPPAACLSKA